MTLKEEMVGLANADKDMLMEGVKYFKFSKRIDKLIYKVAKSKNVEVREKLVKVLLLAKKDFKEAEDEFELGNEMKGKLLYKQAKAKNSVAIKKVMDKEMKGFLIKSGVFAAVGGLLYVISNAVINADPHQIKETLFKFDSAAKDINRELNYFGKEKDASYYIEKNAEVGRKAGHALSNQIDKTTDEFKKNLPQAAEDFKETKKRVIDAYNKMDFSGYVSGLTDEERGFRTR